MASGLTSDLQELPLDMEEPLPVDDGETQDILAPGHGAGTQPHTQSGEL